MEKFPIAIAGFGSFTTAYLQGIWHYTKNETERGVPYPLIGGRRTQDVEVRAVFDVDEEKVGKPIHEVAMLPKNTPKPGIEPIKSDIVVKRGPTKDGILKELRGTHIRESSRMAIDVVKELRDSGAKVLINLTSPNAKEGTYFYGDAAFEAGIGFINCHPEAYFQIPGVRTRFVDAGLLAMGDDTKSQLGATMLMQTIVEKLKERGGIITLDNQVNEGSNMDHLALSIKNSAKMKSKARSVAKHLGDGDVKPTVSFRYVEKEEGKLSGEKLVVLELGAEMWAGFPLRIEVNMHDWISFNGAASLDTAVRVGAMLIERGTPELAPEACAWVFKNPPTPMGEEEAHRRIDALIRGEPFGQLKLGPSARIPQSAPRKLSKVA